MFLECSLNVPWVDEAGFLATILMRVLKNDFIKYSRDDDTSDEQEETGWKYIHGDVFRFPPCIKYAHALELYIMHLNYTSCT
jgi:hypothetical protein